MTSETQEYTAYIYTSHSLQIQLSGYKHSFWIEATSKQARN